MGAYVRVSTTVPYGGGSAPSGNGVVTMIPVARTSHSIVPSS